MCPDRTAFRNPNCEMGAFTSDKITKDTSRPDVSASSKCLIHSVPGG